jgi:hypothetical protein
LFVDVAIFRNVIVTIYTYVDILTIPVLGGGGGYFCVVCVFFFSVASQTFLQESLIKGAGRGLFANANILIGEEIGRMIRPVRLGRDHDVEMEGYAHDTAVTLGKVSWWDAECPRRDSPLSAYPVWYAMNHRIKCNVRGRSQIKVDGPVWVALRDICTGEELTYDYGIVPLDWRIQEAGQDGTCAF